MTADAHGHVARWTGVDFRQKEPLIEVGTSFFYASFHYSILFSQDGQWAAVGSTNGILQVWDLQKRALLRESTVSSERVLPWAFTQRDTRLVVACPNDNPLREWNAAFSPDGQRLALGSNGNEAIKLWDVNSHIELLTLEGRGSVFMASTAFSPDGNLLGSRNGQGLLHLWRAPAWAELFTQ